MLRWIFHLLEHSFAVCLSKRRNENRLFVAKPLRYSKWIPQELCDLPYDCQRLINYAISQGNPSDSGRDGIQREKRKPFITDLKQLTRLLLEPKNFSISSKFFFSNFHLVFRWKKTQITIKFDQVSIKFPRKETQHEKRITTGNRWFACITDKKHTTTTTTKLSSNVFNFEFKELIKKKVYLLAGDLLHSVRHPFNVWCFFAFFRWKFSP